MNIYYLREKPKNGQKKGQLKGCIVVLSSHDIGYSLCHPNDQGNNSKARAREIALERAKRCKLVKGGDKWWRVRDGHYHLIRQPILVEAFERIFQELS